MDIPLTEAKTRLDELAERARAGETIVLTTPGEPALVLVRDRAGRDPGARFAPDGSLARFASVAPLFAAAEPPTDEEKARRRRLFADLAEAVRTGGQTTTEVEAARSQDFLYGPDGLPG